MRVLSNFLVLICIVSSILAYETPGLEVVILIKATSGSVESDYFSSQIVPLVEIISRQLIFPEDVSAEDNEFARISVSVGGNSDDWPVVPLKNQSRSEFLALLKKLSPVEGQPNVGNAGAIKSAVKTLYESSVSNNQAVFLLTDKVLVSDSESDDAKRLSAFAYITSVIGIRSIQNPSFNDSLPAALVLATDPVCVWGSITEALSRRTYSVQYLTSTFMEGVTRICRRILFLYENSDYVDPVSQIKFIAAVSQMVKYFRKDDVIALASFDDLLSDRLAFIMANELEKWHAKPSTTYDVSQGGSVYDKLAEISQTPDFPHLDIVLLAQADVLPQNTTHLMFNLAEQHNVDVFVFDDSQNSSNSQIFQILTKNQTTRIFNIHDTDQYMAQIYANNVYPILEKQDCRSTSNASVVKLSIVAILASFSTLLIKMLI